MAKKAAAKTVENEGSVSDFINAVPDDQKKMDSLKIIGMMKKASGYEPKMWGPAIVGFGSVHYKYASGHEGDMPIVGFSPRKGAITLYLSTAFDKRDELLKKFGKHKTSVACIYINKLSDIDEGVLKTMIANSVKYTRSKYK
jgi:hypothetical protein